MNKLLISIISIFLSASITFANADNLPKENQLALTPEQNLLYLNLVSKIVNQDIIIEQKKYDSKWFSFFDKTDNKNISSKKKWLSDWKRKQKNQYTYMEFWDEKNLEKKSSQIFSDKQFTDITKTNILLEILTYKYYYPFSKEDIEKHVNIEWEEDRFYDVLSNNYKYLNLTNTEATIIIDNYKNTFKEITGYWWKVAFWGTIAVAVIILIYVSWIYIAAAGAGSALTASGGMLFAVSATSTVATTTLVITGSAALIVGASSGYAIASMTNSKHYGETLSKSIVLYEKSIESNKDNALAFKYLEKMHQALIDMQKAKEKLELKLAELEKQSAGNENKIKELKFFVNESKKSIKYQKKGIEIIGVIDNSVGESNGATLQH